MRRVRLAAAAQAAAKQRDEEARIRAKAHQVARIAQLTSNPPMPLNPEPGEGW